MGWCLIFTLKAIKDGLANVLGGRRQVLAGRLGDRVQQSCRRTNVQVGLRHSFRVGHCENPLAGWTPAPMMKSSNRGNRDNRIMRRGGKHPAAKIPMIPIKL
jgi:hypothetical protein